MTIRYDQYLLSEVFLRGGLKYLHTAGVKVDLFEHVFGRPFEKPQPLCIFANWPQQREKVRRVSLHTLNRAGGEYLVLHNVTSQKLSSAPF